MCRDVKANGQHEGPFAHSTVGNKEQKSHRVPPDSGVGSQLGSQDTLRGGKQLSPFQLSYNYIPALKGQLTWVFFPWRESRARAGHGDRIPDARWGTTQRGHQERADKGGLTEQTYRCQVAGGDEALWTSQMGAHVTYALALFDPQWAYRRDR